MMNARTCPTPRLVQHRGRATWYRNYRVRIATVEREYGFPE
jgi:hypothetical protein